jgi:hypothetical protein
MATANVRLEERVAALERELRKVKSQLRTIHQKSQQPWWEQLAGTFKNDPTFIEIVRAGQAYRRSLAARGR